MDLALIRHGIAEDGAEDFSRALTRKGRQRFEQVVRGLERLGQRFDLVLHSPKLRALETAELLAPIAERLEVTSLLTERPSPALLDALAGDQVAVVGHQPHLSELLAWLVVGELRHAPRFELKKGSVALLTGNPTPGSMVLTGLLPPRLFRKAKG